MAAEKIASGLPERQVAVRVKREQAAHEPVTGFERYRAIWCLGLAVFPRRQARRECESSLFSVRLVQPSIEMITKKFAQETDCCHA